MCKRKTREDLFNDVRNGELLEDLAVCRAGEEPEPGDDRCPVRGIRAAFIRLGEAADVAVKVSGGGSIEGFELKVDGLADDCRKVDRRIFAEQIQLDSKWTREGLADACRAQEELVLAQRCFQH